MNKIAVLALLSGLGAVWAAEKFSKEQLEARFYYDLGPAEVDVSAYPKAQRENYPIFRESCSQCHTLARPINSPLVKREDWKRFIDRMHIKSKVWRGTVLTREGEKKILDFLAYDSRVRKVKGKKAFEAGAKELKALFEEVAKERARLKIEEDKAKARPMPPYTGVK